MKRSHLFIIGLLIAGAATPSSSLQSKAAEPSALQSQAAEPSASQSKTAEPSGRGKAGGGLSRLWLRLPQTAAHTPATIATLGDSLLSPDQKAIVSTAEDELRQHWTGNPVMLQLTDAPANAFTVEKSAQGGIRISASTPAGLLYGAYFILRSQAMGDGCLCATLGAEERLTQQPAAPLRPIFLADDLLQISRRGLLTAFARANASIGINAIVITPEGSGRGEQHLKAIADSLQRYGLQLLLPPSYPPDWEEGAPLDPPDWEEVAAPTSSQEPPPVGGGWRGPSGRGPLPFLTNSLLDRWHWYAAGRRAWSPTITPEQMAFEWLAQTLTENPLFIMPMRDQLLDPAADPADLEQQLQEAARRY